MHSVNADELQSHATQESCWVAIHGKVYDVTKFILEHPGGPAVILEHAGRDATVAYDEVHSIHTLKALPQEACIGDISEEQTQKLPRREVAVATVGEETSKPPLSAILSLADFEQVAAKNFTAKTYAFYSSAATDLVTHGLNSRLFRSLLLRPSVLRDVSHCSISSTILGCTTAAPFFVAPAAMAKLAHPDGELALARACAAQGIIQCVSNNASFPVSEIAAANAAATMTTTTHGDQTAAAHPYFVKPHPFFLQLYVNKDRAKTTAFLRQLRGLGCRAVFVTVDAAVPGKREADERAAAPSVAVTAPNSGAASGTADAKGSGYGRLMGSYIDAALSWSDLAWIKRESGGLPLVLKGVQTAADVRAAAAHGAAGVLLSNHGGRALDTAQPALLVLLELHARCPEVFGQLEVYVDGGVMRGTDVAKALALGATAVGVGRPFLYALAYGQEGAEHAVRILKEELDTTVRLLGLNDVRDLHPGLVNTGAIDHLVPKQEGHPWITWKPKSRL